jgi:hypothetical protein
MTTSDDWARQVDEALFGNDASDVPDPHRHDPDAFDLAPANEPPPRAVSVGELDGALFGSAATSALSAPAAPAEPVGDLHSESDFFDEPLDDPYTETIVVETSDETIIAEPADDLGAVGPTGPKRGRRALVVAGFAALVLVIATAAGAVIVSRSDSSRPEGNTVSDRTTAPTTTTTPLPTTTPPVPETSVPAPSLPAPPPPTAARTPTTSRRTVPPPEEPAFEPPPPPAPPPPPPPPSEPPPSTTSPPPPVVP